MASPEVPNLCKSMGMLCKKRAPSRQDILVGNKPPEQRCQAENQTNKSQNRTFIRPDF